jgi:hypothetical protein
MGWLAAILVVPPSAIDDYSPLIFIGGMLGLLLVVVYFKGEPMNRRPRRRE